VPIAESAPPESAPKSQKALGAQGLPGAADRRSWLHLAAKIVLPAAICFAVVVAVQIRSGCYESEFGSHPDEAAHVVTGLLVRDYVFQGRAEPPLDFARNFYLHYPKVGLGHWPPLFYVVQLGWTAVLGDTRTSLMLMMAALASAVATLLWLVARRSLPEPAAAFITVLMLLLPLSQWLSSAVMAELLVALLGVGAALSYARYLHADRPYRWATLFALLAAATIMTKGTGLALALLPPLTILMARRLDLLRTWHFWLPAGLVALLCAPWYVFTLDMARNGWVHESFSLHFVRQALFFYTFAFWRNTGAVVVVLALIGLTRRVLLPLLQRRPVADLWSATAALLLSNWIFHVLVPCGREYRHLMATLPAFLLLAGEGLHVASLLFSRVVPRWGRALTMPAAIGLCLSIVVVGHSHYEKQWHGYGRVARLLSHREWRDLVPLISSDPQGEGMLIAEVALQDVRPSRYMLRASNLLANSNWNDSRYELRFSTVHEVLQYLEEVPVDVLVLDRSIPEHELRPHHRQLFQMVHSHPHQWELIERCPVVRNARVHTNAIEVYRSRSQRARESADVKIAPRLDLDPLASE